MNTSRDGRRLPSGGYGVHPDACTQCRRPIPPGKFLHHLRYDCTATTALAPQPVPESNRVAGVVLQRRDEIRRICARRGIREVVHVTRIEVLASILKEGLLSRETLERQRKENGRFFIAIDRHRFDDRCHMVSVSIAFPNFPMFERRIQADEDSWAILLLKPSLLWELECAFCANNAASRSMSGQTLAALQEPQSLASMFADEVATKYGVVRRSDHILPDWFPTDPQAEVLVDTTIPARYIVAVAFRSWKQQQAWLQQNGYNWPGILLTIQPHFFGPRPS